MEYPALNTIVEWQARRIAVAFEVQTFATAVLEEPPVVIIHEEGSTYKRKVIVFEGFSGSIPFGWSIEPQSGLWTSIEIGWPDKSCELYNIEFLTASAPQYLFHSTTHAFDERMVRGLVRLGFENEEILTRLNHPLSEHERLELRLAFPREFWSPEGGK